MSYMSVTHDYKGVRTAPARLESAGERADHPASKRSAFDQRCVEFLTAHDKRATEWIVRSETVVNLAQSPGNSTAAWDRATPEQQRLAFDASKFKLTHLAPDEYSTKTKSELSGPDGGPLQISAKEAWDLFQEATGDA